MTLAVKWMALIILLSAVLSLPANAACTGSSPTWTSTPDQTSVGTCIANASPGDTINISAGTATWASGVSISGKGLIIQGAGAGRIIATSVWGTPFCGGTGGPPPTPCPISNPGTLNITISSTSASNPGNLGGIIAKGMTLRISELGFRSNFFQGTVNSFNSSTGALSVNVTSFGGTCWTLGPPNTMNSNCKRWLISTVPQTVITNNLASGNLFTITEDSTRHTSLSGIKIIQGPNIGSTNVSDVYLSRTSNGKAVLIHDMWMEQGAVSWPLVDGNTNRGVIWNSSFDSSPFASSGFETLRVKDASNTSMPTSWTTPDTMGMADAAGTAFCPSCAAGENNLYFEDNDVHGSQGWVDFDDNARAVVRYTLLDNAQGGSHGADTSPIGLRHFEFYNNKGIFEAYGDWSTANLNTWLFERGGTFVFYNNSLPEICSSDWGCPRSDIGFAVENLDRNQGPHPCWGQGPSSPGQYYYAPRQQGLGYVTGTGSTQGTQSTGFFGPASRDVLTYVGDHDPIYIWNNACIPGGAQGCNNHPTAGVAMTGFAVSLGQCTNPDSQSNYIVQNRDFFNTTSTARPGYTAFTYPHPLRQGTASAPSPTPSPTPAPAAPTALTTTVK